MADKQPISLKVEGRWMGYSDESALHPTTGRFSTFKNGYVSDDGTEIRAFPAFKKLCTPVYGEEFTISAMTAGNPTLVTLAGAASGEHLVKDNGATNDTEFYFLGNGVIADGRYLGRFQTTTQVWIDVNTAGTSLIGKVYVVRKYKLHAMRQVGHRLALIGEGRVWDNAGTLSRTATAGWIQNPRSLAATGATAGNPTTITIGHGYATGQTFRVTLTGFSGLTPTINSSYTATATGAGTFTVPVSTAGTGVAGRVYFDLLDWNGTTAFDYQAGASAATPIVPFTYWPSPLIYNGSKNTGITATVQAPPTDPALINCFHGVALVGQKFKVALTGLNADGVPDGTYYAIVTQPYAQFSIYTDPGYTTSEGATAAAATGSATIDFHRYTREPRRRINVDVNGGRVICSVPGEGVNLELNNHELKSSAVMSAVGIPKAILYTAGFSGGAGTFGAGAYTMAVAYKDPSTGEIGLLSEPRTETAVANNSLSVEVYRPRRCLRETFGLSVVLYMSDVGGGAGTMKPVAEKTSTDVHHTNLTFSLTALPTPVSYRVPDIEQMPKGSSVNKTVKGVSFFGGSYPVSQEDHDDDEAVQILNVKSPLNNEFQVDTGSGAFETFATDGQIPTSYQGEQMYVYGIQHALTKRVNPGAAEPNQLWQIDSILGGTSSTGAYVTLPRGRAWFSERGFPGITPAINNIYVDRIKGYDITAFGRVLDNLVICTDKETYLLSWSRSPLGTDPILLSTEYGCVAPNSMVQFEGGCAWISADGPVILRNGSGVVEPIFGPIFEKWRTYKRDSRGFMGHAWALHDPRRGLIYFFVRSDLVTTTYATTATDDEKTKVPCDEVAVWSYKSNAWSFWELPSGYEFFDGDSVLCYDGQYRTGFLNKDGDVYAIDESFNYPVSSGTWGRNLEIITTLSAFNQLGKDSRITGVSIRFETDSDTVNYPTLANASVIAADGTETVVGVGVSCSGNQASFNFGSSRSTDSKIRLYFINWGKFNLKDVEILVGPGGP